LPDAALEENRIAEEASRLWAALFDTHYTLLLGVIHLSLLISDSPAGEPLRTDLATHAIDYQMKGAIGPLARTLVGRPRKPGIDGSVLAASPPFSNPIVPASGDQPTLAAFLRTKLAESDDLLAKLAPAPPLPPPLPTIQSGNADLRALLDRLPVA
jgi:hypothetical protein